VRKTNKPAPIREPTRSFRHVSMVTISAAAASPALRAGAIRKTRSARSNASGNCRRDSSLAAQVGAIEHVSGAVVSSLSPAAPGEIVVVYATGLVP
jgi:uncharacterized protein (TIGR03437 family)